ncbi:MAG: hypothetical protein AAFQ11_01435 [Pseudomonadota bacterium]
MTSTDRPTHRAFFVDDRGNGTSSLIEIAGAWPTKNGDGLNLRLPMGLQPGARLTIMPIDWDAIDAKSTQS